MGEFAIQNCVDTATNHPLVHDELLFVRRVSPPLPDTYQLVCGPRRTSGGSLGTMLRCGDICSIYTGRVRVSTEHTYVAAWYRTGIGGSAVGISSALRALTASSPYAIRPTREDEQRRRISALRWTSPASPLSAADAAFAAVMTELGMDPAPFMADRAVRRAAIDRLLEAFRAVRACESTGILINTPGDSMPDALRSRLMDNPRYSTSPAEMRVFTIDDYVLRLDASR